MKSNIKVCDFCGSDKLASVYRVPSSRLGMKVYLCEHCSLVQSFSTKADFQRKKTPSISSDANWGNIRHGKGLRFTKARFLLESKLNWSRIRNILDVGSNRGDFIKWAISNYSKIRATAVEPDKTIIDDYKNLNRVTMIKKKFEETDLKNNIFDFIYCSHTLEHARSAAEMLQMIYQSLKDGGQLFLEVPNLEVVNEDDVVEEFFLDKHTYHFNRKILIDYLKWLGFIVKDGEKSNDNYNISLLLKKTTKVPNNKFSINKQSEVKFSKKIINKYKLTLNRNRKKIKHVADRLNGLMNRQRVVFWGGGKIFDALIRYGKLNSDRLVGLIDVFLAKYLDSVHEVKLQGPEILRFESPDVLVILAKSSADDIERQGRAFGIRHIIKFTDLINSI